MEPYFTKHNPIDEIGVIKIFSPEYDDLGQLCYPVHIDDLILTFYMERDRSWQHKETALLPPKVKRLAGILIENSHL